MNFLKKIAQNKKNKQDIQESIDSINTSIYFACTAMSKLLTAIHHSSSDFPNIQAEIHNLYQQNKSDEIAKQLFNFEYNLNNIKKELDYIKQFNKTSFSKKLNKKIIEIEEKIDTLKFSFIEVYSKFLVLVQFNTEFKDKLKANFIKIIKEQEIPIHTDEKSK